MNEIRRKASDLDIKGRSRRNINNTSQNNKNSQRNNRAQNKNKTNDDKKTKKDENSNNDRNVNLSQQNKFSLSREAWAALSQEQ